MASADLLRLAMVRETTPGVTPATPAFMVARITSEGLNFNPTTALSNELNPARQVSDVIVSGGSSGGDVGFEVSRNPWFEEMLSAVLGNDWDITLAGRLEVGSILKSYTTEKRFTLDSLLGVYDFHTIIRTIVDSMTLTFTPGGADTGSVTLLGGTYSRADAGVAGATYVGPNTAPVMVGSDVIPIRLTIEGTDYEAWCFSAIGVTFRNNGRAIECLGTEGAAEMVMGRFECEITAQIYVVDGTEVVMDAFLQKQELGFAFIANDADGESYAFDFPRCRVQSASQVAGGTNQDVVLDVTLQALVSLTGAAPAVNSCVLITRNPATPASVLLAAEAEPTDPVLDLPADYDYFSTRPALGMPEPPAPVVESTLPPVKEPETA
jgi:hypothetical protein